MKAKDLMIGDWVRIMQPKDFHGNERRLQVTEISEADDSICYFSGDAGGELTISTKYLEPIPLTPEILEKNGFKNDFYEEESVADYHTIRLEGYSLKHKIGKIDGYLVTWCNGGVNVTTDLHGCVQKDISYVHELQHALKLCGIEKEIVL